MKRIVLLLVGLLLVGCVPMDRNLVSFRASSEGVGEFTVTTTLVEMPWSENTLHMSVGADTEDQVVGLIGVGYQADDDSGAFCINYGGTFDKDRFWPRLDFDLLKFGERAMSRVGITGIYEADHGMRIHWTAGAGITF